MSNFGMVKLIAEAGHLGVMVSALVTTESSKIKTVRKNSDDLARARKLQKAMTEFFADVDIVCVEIPVGSQSARAMASYGMCIGVLASLDKPLIQVTPTEVKLAAVGTKTASKKEMIAWAVDKQPQAKWLTRKSKGEVVFTNANEHLADALATIYAGSKTDEFKLLSIGK